MAYHENDNDGRFPDDSRVEVRYPRTRQEEHGDRATWPWLPGSIVEQCGPDEWRVCVEDRGVAVLRDGRPAPRNTASRNLYYPMCFRDSSEIRRPAPAGSQVVYFDPQGRRVLRVQIARRDRHRHGIAARVDRAGRQ